MPVTTLSSFLKERIYDSCVLKFHLALEVGGFNYPFWSHSFQGFSDLVKRRPLDFQADHAGFTWSPMHGIQFLLGHIGWAHVRAEGRSSVVLEAKPTEKVPTGRY